MEFTRIILKKEFNSLYLLVGIIFFHVCPCYFYSGGFDLSELLITFDKNKHMRKIFKYELAHTDVHIKHLPCDCTILSVQEQNGALVMWAEVDPDSEYIRMNIYIVGTGNPMPEGANTYIGTVQMSNGLVWHVFS